MSGPWILLRAATSRIRTRRPQETEDKDAQLELVKREVWGANYTFLRQNMTYFGTSSGAALCHRCCHTGTELSCDALTNTQVREPTHGVLHKHMLITMLHNKSINYSLPTQKIYGTENKSIHLDFLNIQLQSTHPQNELIQLTPWSNWKTRTWW